MVALLTVLLLLPTADTALGIVGGGAELDFEFGWAVDVADISHYDLGQFCPPFDWTWVKGTFSWHHLTEYLLPTLMASPDLCFQS